MDRWFQLLVLGLVGVAFCGCTPSSSTQADEEKESHYLIGKARITGLDFRGAIEAFDEALVVNPKSGAAHFMLGWLYAEKEADPAAAIHHYQKFLQLRPTDDMAGIVQQHIFRLKQDLAKAVLPLPSTPGVQREFEQLAEDNRRLKDEVERLKGILAAKGITATNPVVSVEPETRGQSIAPSTNPVRTGSPAASAAKTAMRTHRVQAGESPAAIARRYNVKLDAFMAANPGLVAKRMQVGQLVQVPGIRQVN